jgi:serine/threonine protein kinase
VEHVGIGPGDSLADRYTVQRELGRGGMATVYLADDTRHRRPVAVKVMHEELSHTVGKERFLREIEIAARLQHPHILPLFDSGSQGGRLYYVMPFVEGESLRDRLRSAQPLSVAEATRVAREVAGALGYAHERGVVHRDIKPENIMLSKGIAVVADFGIASALSEPDGNTLTASGMVLGTPAYMSPEQSDVGVSIDGRADIYALGCVLYEMLAGVPAYSGPNFVAILSRKLTEDPQPLSQVRPDVPAHVARAVVQAMSRTLEDRFPTCAAFAEALDAADAPRISKTRPSDTLNTSGRPTAVRADTPNLGPLVSRMCNRWRQVNSFDAFFRESQQRAPGRPQVHVVHGPEGESHDSLVERIVATRLTHFATEIGGDERGTVKALRIPWPEGDDLETRRRDLAISLFREVASGYMGHELTALALSRQASLALCPIVAIHHDIRTSSWDRVTEDLLQWYVNDFWGALPAGAQVPLFVVFLKVIAEPVRPTSRLASWFRPLDRRRVDVIARMQAVLGAPNTRCAVHIASELTPVTENDVKDWFNQHGLYDTERARHERASSIFRNTPRRPMAEVEAALEEIRSSLVRQHSPVRGEGTW